MNAITIYNNPDFGEIRTTTIDGEPWFVGKDVARILGYKNESKALKDHVDPEDKLNNESLLSLGQRGGWLINESGLYSLILSSKLPKAKKFKRWVTSEVLPAIRKTGGYMTPEMERLLLETQMQVIERLERLERNGQAERPRPKHTGIHIPDGTEQERRGKLTAQVRELARLVNLPVNTLFHQLYLALEKTEGISVDAYTSVYRSETGDNHASPLYMIAASEKLYQAAHDLLDDTIRRNRVF